MPVSQFDDTEPSTPTVSECSEATLPLFPKDWDRHLRTPLSHQVSRYSQAILDTLGCERLVSPETALENFKNWIEECGGLEKAYEKSHKGGYPEEWVEIKDVCLDRE